MDTISCENLSFETVCGNDELKSEASFLDSKVAVTGELSQHYRAVNYTDVN